MHPAFFRFIALLCALGCSTASAAEQVLCHVAYGGETQDLRASATHSPYTVAPVSIGSYFLVRVVFDRTTPKLAAVKIYTFADRDEGAVPIHVAEFPYPVAAHGRYGFTGMQRVYEPVRDGELEYWCEMIHKGGAK